MARDLTELNKLEAYLKKHDIPYERFDDDDVFDSVLPTLKVKCDRHQIIVPCADPNKREWDAICQFGSYGNEEGLLEIYGHLVDEKADGDTVAGWLTADDVIKRIERRDDAEIH